VNVEGVGLAAIHLFEVVGVVARTEGVEVIVIKIGGEFLIVTEVDQGALLLLGVEVRIGGEEVIAIKTGGGILTCVTLGMLSEMTETPESREKKEVTTTRTEEGEVVIKEEVFPESGVQHGDININDRLFITVSSV